MTKRTVFREDEKEPQAPPIIAFEPDEITVVINEASVTLQQGLNQIIIARNSLDALRDLFNVLIVALAQLWQVNHISKL